MAEAPPAAGATVPVVETVTGRLPVSELGVVLAHEHLRTRHETMYTQFPHLYDDAASTEVVVAAIAAAAALGLRTYCDATVMGLGRDVRFMAEVARRTGVAVVASTGVYTFDELPPYFNGRDPEVMTAAFVHDLRVGIQGTDIRAGFLKCATDAKGFTPGVVKVIRAVGQASAETGAPVMTHSLAPARNGLEQLRLLVAEGARPAGICIGHSGDTDDVEYLSELADEGVFLGMDRYGAHEKLPYALRNATVVELCRRGYAGQLLLSQDHSIARDIVYAPQAWALRSDWNTTFVLGTVLPELERLGVEPAVVRDMVTENPARWLTPR